jgi:hypothetical protein
MKKMYFPLILLMSLALVISACKKDDDDDDNNGPGPSPTGYSIAGYSQDAVNFTQMAGALITVTDQQGAQVAQVTTDNGGNYLVTGVEAGTYVLSVSKDGYQPQVANNVVVGNPNLQEVFVGFMPVDNSITTPVGALCGVVLDADGNALANASVAISAEDESLTNGYFASVMSDNDGKFAIGAIPLEANVKADTIPAFKIKVIQDNYIEVVNNIVIAENSLVVQNVDLVNQNVPGNTIFSEGFEAQSAWMYDGFWHRQQNASILNSNVTNEYVRLAPNDQTSGFIPSAYAGSYCAWYGQESTGSFIGEASTGQEQWSGGTSLESNMGYMLSPEIDLTGESEASLSFWSWFEIESMNPNENGYDIMEVYISEVGGDEVSLGRLNPFSDPILDDRASLPFTSGGFNKAPLWVNTEYDLTDFAGKTIQLKFEFRTVDDLYNGFRGWFVDNILVTDKAPLKSANVRKVYGPDPKPRTH